MLTFLMHLVGGAPGFFGQSFQASKTKHPEFDGEDGEE